MISPTLAGLIISVILLECSAQFLVRLYYENKTKIFLAFIAWGIYLGVVFILTLMYDYSKLAIANALWDSGTIIAMSLIGWLYFGEPLSVGEMVGMGLVIAGAVTIGITTSDKDELI